jgi:hypothetical protein
MRNLRAIFADLFLAGLCVRIHSSLNDLMNREFVKITRRIAMHFSNFAFE